MSREQDFLLLMEALHEYSQQVENLNRLPRAFADGEIFHMAELHLLKSIIKFKLATVTDIARHQNKTTSAVSQLVKKLLDKGLLQKSKDPDNNKNIILSITEKGKRINKLHDAFDRDSYLSVMSAVDGCPDEGIRAMTDTARALTEKIRGLSARAEDL